MANTAMHRKHALRIPRFMRFMMVGLSGTVVDFSLLTVLKEIVGLGTLPANTLSFTAGLVNNFTWNRLWTFSEVASSDVKRQFLKFALVSVIGLLLNNLIVLALEIPLATAFGIDGYGYIPAKIIATSIVFLWNFNANRLWTFNIHKQES